MSRPSWTPRVGCSIACGGILVSICSCAADVGHGGNGQMTSPEMKAGEVIQEIYNVVKTKIIKPSPKYP